MPLYRVVQGDMVNVGYYDTLAQAEACALEWARDEEDGVAEVLQVILRAMKCDPPYRLEKMS